jgi:hypothetical protein
MAAPIPAATNKRIRALIKEGFAYIDIAKECGVSAAHVSTQAAMLEALGRFKRTRRRGDGCAVALEKHGTASARKANLIQGRDVDESGIDLVSLFETPRTPKQLKRYWSGE